MSDETAKTVFAWLVVITGIVAGLPLLLLVSSCVNGWVLTKLWAWFMVPIFHLPALTLWPAIGVAMVIRFLTYQDTNNKRGIGESVALAVIQPIVSLGFGWLIHWMGR